MKKSGLKWLLMIALMAVGVRQGWQEIKAQGADLLPIKYVRIEGVFQYLTKDEIKQAVLAYVMTGLLNADMQSIKQALMKLPWIAEVKVKRVWPDAIEIKVYEQYPIARWDSAGLLNEQGDLFRPDNLAQFDKLPLLYGPEGQQKKLVEWMQQLQTQLAHYALELAELDINERRAWTVVLTNDLILKLGRRDPLQKFQQFLPTIPILGKQRIAMMSIVDLRYPNGYAVTWKQNVGQTEQSTDTTDAAQQQPITSTEQ